MTTRERAIEAMARAVVGLITPVISLDDLPRDRPALRVHQRAGGDLVDTQDDLVEIATAALDAALEVLGEPGEEMVEAGVDKLFWADSDSLGEDAKEVFRAMLATLARKES